MGFYLIAAALGPLAVLLLPLRILRKTEETAGAFALSFCLLAFFIPTFVELISALAVGLLTYYIFLFFAPIPKSRAEFKAAASHSVMYVAQALMISCFLGGLSFGISRLFN